MMLPKLGATKTAAGLRPGRENGRKVRLGVSFFGFGFEQSLSLTFSC